MRKFFNCSRRALLVTGAASMGIAILGGRHAFAQSAKRPIGIIGAGNIGGTIGGLWVKAGHPVMFSSRDPDELKDMVVKFGPLARAGTVAQAIAFGDAVFIAVPYAALPQIGRDYRNALKGKIVLDACNQVATRDGDAISKEVEENGIGITSQKYLAGTRLVRAFNTLGFETFAKEANRRAPMLAEPIAGDDADAVRVAEELVRDAGFEPVVVGKLADARKIQRGGAGYMAAATTPELKQKLGLAP